MRAEQLAKRGIEDLRDALLGLSAIANRMLEAAVPEDSEVIAAYRTAAGTTALPPNLGLDTIRRRSIEQDRAARDLGYEINTIWQTLRVQMGS